MAIQRTWVGGGSNDAGDLTQWSPAGVPQPGDTLLVGPHGSLTMNISGNDLAGDGIAFFGAIGFTVNLTHKGVVTNATLTDTHSTWNLSQNSDATIQSEVGINIGSITTVNISGHDTLTLSGDATINIDPGSRWDGTINGGGVITGGSSAVWKNDGSSSFSVLFSLDGFGGADFTVDAAVTGSGTISLAGQQASNPNKLEFLQSVGRHQTVTNTGIVQIDQPNEFAAHAILAQGYDVRTQALVPSEFDLEGLANADSYTFRNDMLNIFAGNKVIDTLKLADQTQFGFDVVKTPSSVNVVALTSMGETIPGALPIHVIRCE